MTPVRAVNSTVAPKIPESPTMDFGRYRMVPILCSSSIPSLTSMLSLEGWGTRDTAVHTVVSPGCSTVVLCISLPLLCLPIFIFSILSIDCIPSLVPSLFPTMGRPRRPDSQWKQLLALSSLSMVLGLAWASGPPPRRGDDGSATTTAVDSWPDLSIGFNMPSPKYPRPLAELSIQERDDICEPTNAALPSLVW